MTFWQFAAEHPYMAVFFVFIIACAVSDIADSLRDRRNQ